MEQIDSVDEQRALTLSLTGSGGQSSKSRQGNDPTTDLPQHMLDVHFRTTVIEKYISYKRSIHLKKGTRGALLTRTAPIVSLFSESSNLKVVKKFLTEKESTAERELLNRQLGDLLPLEGGVKTKSNLMRGRSTSNVRHLRQRPFLCLTDPDLGKPWRQIVEELVREDIARLKRVREEKNAKAFEERISNDKKRGIPMPSFSGLKEKQSHQQSPTTTFAPTAAIATGTPSPPSHTLPLVNVKGTTGSGINGNSNDSVPISLIPSHKSVQPHMMVANLGTQKSSSSQLQQGKKHPSNHSTMINASSNMSAENDHSGGNNNAVPIFGAPGMIKKTTFSPSVHRK
jgi:hypothetical protein